MKKKDLIAVCLQNLMRRKARTFLTVLGVLVGCCSIVIMVSIGIGMKESQEKMLSEMGDLTIISVYSQNNGGMGIMGGATSGGAGKGKRIDDTAVKAFKQIPGVVAASPKMGSDGYTIKLYAGKDRRYICDYSTVVGIEKGAVEKIGYKLTDGSYLGAREFEVMVGQFFAYSFRDSKRPEGSNTVDLYSMYNPDGTVGKPPDAYFNPMGTPLYLEISSEEGKTYTQELTPVGAMKEDYGKGWETSQGMLMDIKDMRKLFDALRRLYGGKVVNSSYDTVLVKVSDISMVAEIETEIKGMGFRTDSMESIRKPMEKEAEQKQMMLGGLGAISLFVAALGITNTMIMSISERTREIGVMKALGCYVHDIRSIFLMEAGCIGLLGGFAGVILSAAISVAMNIFSAQVPITSITDMFVMLTQPGSRMSVIPFWLVIFALVFSVVIGVGSGFYPANKAVSISALEAIKHD